MKKFYYSTQKEMLARILENSLKGSLLQLPDRLTKPVLSLKKKNFMKLLNIGKKFLMKLYLIIKKIFLIKY